MPQAMAIILLTLEKLAKIAKRKTHKEMEVLCI